MISNNMEFPLLEVVVTARPSWARVKFLVKAYAEIAGEDRIRLSLVGPAVSHRYGDLTKSIPDWLTSDRVSTLQDSDNLDAVALTCVQGATALINKWSQNRPDAVLVIADRTETLGVAVAAAVMQIPLIHLQGGEVSGSIDDKIRDANTKLADLHLTTNVETASRILSMGEEKLNIRVVGCPSIDVVANQMSLNENIRDRNSAHYGGVGADFNLCDGFGIIMFHPDTYNENENIDWVNFLLNLTTKIDTNWFWFWPNPDHGSSEISRVIRHFREENSLNNIRFVINLSPEDFVNLALNADMMIGNSSFGIRESSFIGLPVINIGKRQIGRQRSNNVHDLIEIGEFESSLTQIVIHTRTKRFPRSSIYGSGNSGKLAAQEIAAWEPKLKVRHS